jgi:hypothetical protein
MDDSFPRSHWLPGQSLWAAPGRRNLSPEQWHEQHEDRNEVVLVKHSHLSKAPVGIHVTNRTADVFLIGNSFEDVH